MAKAQEFAQGKIIFTIKGVSGLDLETLLAVARENEVLVRPQLKMSVEIHLKSYNSKSVIRNKTL